MNQLRASRASRIHQKRRPARACRQRPRRGRVGAGRRRALDPHSSPGPPVRGGRRAQVGRRRSAGLGGGPSAIGRATRRCVRRAGGAGASSGSSLAVRRSSVSPRSASTTEATPHDQVLVGHVHHAHALGGAARAADDVHRDADDLAQLRDQQQLLALAHRPGGDSSPLRSVTLIVRTPLVGRPLRG